MNILTLNTAFSNSDVALQLNGVIDKISLDSSAKQSENILVCVDKILENNNAKIQDIDVLGVVVGPGSFTGIRIGVGLVKGMYMAKKSIKLVSICSLDLMAYEFSKINNKENYYCVLDALSGNIFACEYNNGKRIGEPTMVCDMDMFNNKIVVGLENENFEFCSNKVKFTPDLLLDYTIQQVNVKNFVEENNLFPIYLRKSQAEVGLENENKKN